MERVVLTQGGMGRTIAARDRRLGRVAIKELRTHSVEPRDVAELTRLLRTCCRRDAR
ncbi:MAG TPA: hypothetical protein VEL05_06415 [Candidatus Acidoferrum sp.]|nr:hypothetical protein [Candidatus Acidoferrum sp.]